MPHDCWFEVNLLGRFMHICSSVVSQYEPDRLKWKNLADRVTAAERFNDLSLLALSSHPVWPDAPVREAEAEGRDGDGGQGGGRPPGSRPEDAGQADLRGLSEEL